jgi:hypothetical protein
MVIRLIRHLSIPKNVNVCLIADSINGYPLSGPFIFVTFTSAGYSEELCLME